MWILKYLFDIKLKIARLDRETKLKKLASNIATDIASAHVDTVVIGQPHRLFKEMYDEEYAIQLARLMETK